MRYVLASVIIYLLPLNLSAQCWSEISGGGTHSLALKADSSIWACGENNRGQIGDSTNNQRNNYTRIGTRRDWVSISAGSTHNIALRVDGTIWTWGHNFNGGLGNGTNLDMNYPIQIGFDTNWVQVSAGNGFTMALKSDGTLWSWGSNNHGELGNGSLLSTNTPAQIGTDTDWAKIHAGDGHVLAIKNNGSLWAWGWNIYGAIGDSTNITRTTPTQIGNDLDWKEIAAGFQYSMALKNDSTLWTWGKAGQIGNGGTQLAITPSKITADSNWVYISAGNAHAFAINALGELWGWGRTYSGQLGNFISTGTFHNPVKIGTDTNWLSVAASKGSHTIALKNMGDMWAWGSNAYGQHGLGTALTQTATHMLVNCPLILSAPIIAQVSSTVCANASIQTAKLMNPQGTIAISLNSTPITTYNPADSTFTYSVLAPGTHTISVQYSNTNGNSSNSVSFVTYGIPMVTISTIPSNTSSLCFGDSIALIANGGNSISWNNNVSNNTLFAPSNTTTYTVIVTDSNSCSNTDSITVTVLPIVSPTLNITSSVIGGSTNDPVTLTATTNLSSSYSIDWYRNNIFQTTSSANSWNTNIVAGNNNIYAVIHGTGCISPDSAISNTITISNVTSLKSTSKSIISVTPNPFNDRLYLQNITLPTQVTIIDALGKVKSVRRFEGQNRVEYISTDDLPKGLYFIIAKDENSSFSYKILKQ